MELKATVLQDKGLKDWAFNGRTGTSRSVLVRLEDNTIVLFKSDVSVDLTEKQDEEVTLLIGFQAGERLAAIPRVVGFVAE